MPRHYMVRRRPRRKLGNSVIHVPATINGTIATSAMTLFVIESPSIFAAGSASSNIEAQDKDRTVNVGHHLGRFTIDMSIRNTTNQGLAEFCVLKVERADATPAIGTHPIPSASEVNTQGMQQACRLANPGKVFHTSMRTWTPEHNITHKIIVSPAKFKLSKVKAGDHWVLLVFNRSNATYTIDFQCRYKEYE